jgi:membrane associated rhomboid family serine protease
MSALICPYCREKLLQIPLHGRVSHICPLRHGRALATSAVRRWLMRDAVGIFDQAVAKSKTGKLRCPRCAQGMRVFKVGIQLELDQCTNCDLTWFDLAEHDKLPNRPAEDLEKEANASVIEVDVQEGLLFRAGMSPYENVIGDTKAFPVGTLLMILAFTLASFLMKVHGWEYFVFDARHPLRGLGLPLFLSIFAHAGASHLVGNILFFFLPANVVESTLGDKVLWQVFLLAGLGGALFQAVLSPNSVSLGASGGIAGIYTVLCLTQPQAIYVTQFRQFGPRAMPRLGLMFFTFTARVPFVFIFLSWFLLQLLGVIQQIAVPGRGRVGYLAHLGGILVGAAYVFVSDLRVISPQGRKDAAN